MNAKQILTKVYGTLQANGYNAARQLRDYLLTGDPTYISDVDGARTLICSVDRADFQRQERHGGCGARRVLGVRQAQP